MAADDTPDRGRESFGGQAWGDAYAQLSAADQEPPLEPEDLELLATPRTWSAGTRTASMSGRARTTSS
jgi:hypothetical protein